MALSMTADSSYPVDLEVEPQLRERNRLTTLVRLILFIPHWLLVGGPGFTAFSFGWYGGQRWFGGIGSGGVIGAVAAACALIAWFAILFTRKHPKGLYDLSTFYLRWRVKAVAYAALLRDEYPPFGDGEYPVHLELGEPPAQRDLWSVGLRIFYAIPHLIVLAALTFAWAVTSLIAWFAILSTGNYPEGMYQFGVGVFRWQTRVEAYLLLLQDEYPPFRLDH